MALKDDASASRKIQVVKNAVPGTYAIPDRANAGKFYEVMPAEHRATRVRAPHRPPGRVRADGGRLRGGHRRDPLGTGQRLGQDGGADRDRAQHGADERQRRRPGPARDDRLHERRAHRGRPVPAGRLRAGRDGRLRRGLRRWRAGKTLTAELQSLPAGSNWALTMVFSFASTTVMGASGQVAALPHEHPVMPRHLQEFRALVANRWPDASWDIK